MCSSTTARARRCARAPPSRTAPELQRPPRRPPPAPGRARPGSASTWYIRLLVTRRPSHWTGAARPPSTPCVGSGWRRPRWFGLGGVVHGRLTLWPALIFVGERGVYRPPFPAARRRAGGG